MSKRPLKLDTPKAVRRSLAKLTNEIRSGDISPQVGNACIVGCNAILSAIRTDEQEKKIAELENLLKDAEAGGV